MEQNATLTNSGSIISEQYDAIFLLGNNATLNLLAGTVIRGRDQFDPAADNTVSFGPGLNALMTLYDIPDTILTGDNPLCRERHYHCRARSGPASPLADDMALTLAGDVAGMAGGSGGQMPWPPPDGSTGDDACAHRGLARRLWRVRWAVGQFRPRRLSTMRAAARSPVWNSRPVAASAAASFWAPWPRRGTVGESQDTTQQGGVVRRPCRLRAGRLFCRFLCGTGSSADRQRAEDVADSTVDGGLALASASRALGYFISPAVTDRRRPRGEVPAS